MTSGISPPICPGSISWRWSFPTRAMDGATRGALTRYDVAYQPGAPQVELRRQRFFA